MERIEDSIEGKRVAVVYGAEQLPLSRRSGRLARGRQVRRHARRYRASHLLRVVGSGADGETWWFGKAGFSFAAVIEAWAETVDEVNNDVVVVPLDDRIYAARLDGREVEEEIVLGEARLAEQFRRWNGRTVRAFEAGRLGRALEPMVALEPLPFDLRSMRFRSAPAALTAAGLFAPRQAGVGLVAAAVVVGWHLYADWQAGRVADVRVAARQAERRVAALEGDFSAAAALRGIAGIAWDDDSLLLHRDGLAHMSYGGGFEVTFSGHASGFPAAAEKYAQAHGAAVVVGGTSWEVNRLVPWGVPDPRSVAGHPGRRLAVRAHAVAESAGAELSGAEAVAGEFTEERRFSIRVANPTPNVLVALAAGVDGLPFRLASAQCMFEQYLASMCELGVVAKGVSE